MNTLFEKWVSAFAYYYAIPYLNSCFSRIDVIDFYIEGTRFPFVLQNVFAISSISWIAKVVCIII